MANLGFAVFAMSLAPAFGQTPDVCNICKGLPHLPDDTIAFPASETTDGNDYACGMYYNFSACDQLTSTNFYRCCEGMEPPVSHPILEDPQCDQTYDVEAGVHCFHGEVLAPDYSNIYIDGDGIPYFGLPAGSQWMCEAAEVSTLTFYCFDYLIFIQYNPEDDALIADYESRCCKRHSGMTCGEVKTEYKSQGCCKNPDKPFMTRRLGAVKGVAASSQPVQSKLARKAANAIPREDLEGFVKEGIAKAKARGGTAAVKKLKAEILDLVKEYSPTMPAPSLL